MATRKYPHIKKGDRLGNLVALEDETGTRRRNNSKIRVRCGCGEEFFANANALLYGRQQGCSDCATLVRSAKAAKYDGLSGGRIGNYEFIEFHGFERVNGSYVRPIYTIRDVRCGHTRRIAYQKKFTGLKSLCGCPVKIRTAEGYIHWRWRRPAGTNFHIPEHRIVMEREIGRELEPHETVHHINGIRDDNRPENLQLRSGHHGSGAVRVCGDCGSHNVITIPLAEAS